MFTVTGAVVLSSLAGCGIPDGPFKGPDGKLLTTASGAQIEVVETPQQPQKISANASMKERLDHANRPVQISRSDAELALEYKDEVAKRVIERIRSVTVTSRDFKTVFKYVDGRLQILPEVVRGALPAGNGQQASEGVVTALCALIEPQVQAYLEQNVFPKMVDEKLAKLRPQVEKCVAEGKFATAREWIWRASTSGIPQVDDPVRVAALELMHVKVNPGNWKEVEKKIQAAFDSAMKSKDYDGGIEALKKIGNAEIVREYSQLIDKKLAAIKEELKRLNIDETAMKPIFDKQAAVISAAEKIIDVCDIEKLGNMTSKERLSEARKDPALADYYRSLDAFRKTLILFNCDKQNANSIAINLDTELIALIDMLRQNGGVLPVGEDGLPEVPKQLLLGTRSLNDRIRAKVAESIHTLASTRDAELLAAAKSDLEAKVRALVAEGKFEEARELIWNSAVTGKADWDSEMFALGLSLLRNVVNPPDWERIEKDILDNFKSITATGDFVKLREFLENYPLIRQHSVKLCDQLERVRKEAEKLGADSDAAFKAAQEACAMVTEAEQLVDHLDEIVSDASSGGAKEVDKSLFQKELEIYAVKLAAYHATPENVSRIVERLRLSLESLIANPTNPETTHLVLGTNAVNDRIRALIASLLAKLDETKTEWQEQEHARVVTDLEKRVRKAVKELRFDDARAYIRDEKLIGRQDLDLSLYELRVGLLDSCVNPAQLDFLLADIEAKVKELWEAKDYAGILEFIENYPYVHDQYREIDAALEAVKNAMLALEISAKESEYDEKVRFFNSIQEILEKRRESWTPERDLSDVEKALNEVAKAMFAHLNKHPEQIETEKKEEYLHILADIAALDRTITTWELNERLRVKLAEYVDSAKAALALQEYEKFLAKIDAEVSFDSQIAYAEEAISRQLGVECDRASFKINALLGEYARVFRLLKKGVKLDEAQATTILLGAAYLDQARVADYALGLGANINGVSDRDPRGRTALALAIDTGHFGLVEKLVKAGASLKATDKDGNAIVHYAAKSGNISVLRAITVGAPINVKNNCGNTPLAIAVVRNQPAIVEFIASVFEDADDRAEFVNSVNEKGDTAFDIAARFGSRDVLDALAAAGATYGTKDLVIAEEADHVAIAQWLVMQGLDVNAEGVMAAACPKTFTGRYLIHEGGVHVKNHACAKCSEGDADGVADAGKSKVGSGNGNGNGGECKCVPVPVDVLLVPQCQTPKTED